MSASSASSTAPLEERSSSSYPPCSIVPMSAAARRAVLLENVDVVIDAGANTGQYARWLRGLGYRGRIASLEPVQGTFVELSRACEGDAEWACRRVALGDHDGTAEILVTSDSTGSSLFRKAEIHKRLLAGNDWIATEQVELRCLPSLWPDLVTETDRVYLKLDIEGAELAVLQSAAELLPRVCLIELELHVIEMYEGAATVEAVLPFVFEHGFSLVSLEHNGGDDRATGRMLMLDGIFCNRRLAR
jgi:FkbM family methyltransferase